MCARELGLARPRHPGILAGVIVVFHKAKHLGIHRQLTPPPACPVRRDLQLAWLLDSGCLRQQARPTRWGEPVGPKEARTFARHQLTTPREPKTGQPQGFPRGRGFQQRSCRGA